MGVAATHKIKLWRATQSDAIQNENIFTFMNLLQNLGINMANIFSMN